jgi:hypothetical protein
MRRARQGVGGAGVLFEAAPLGSRTLARHRKAFMLYRGRRIAGRRWRRGAAAFLGAGIGARGIRAAGRARGSGWVGMGGAEGVVVAGGKWELRLEI